jgi:hypothetical protein
VKFAKFEKEFDKLKEKEKNSNPLLFLSFSLLAQPLFLFQPEQASQPA